MKTPLTILIIAVFCLPVSAIDIDGKNITGDFANATWKVYQDVADDWGGNNCIVAMYVETNETHLLVGIPSFVNNNAIGFLIDANSGIGSNVMPSGLTMPDSICAGMAGMTFDSEFTPDLAIALRTGDEASNDAGWPALENITTDTRTYLGTLEDIRGVGSVITNGGIILGALLALPPGLDETNTFPEGLEFSMSYDEIDNNSETVRVMGVVTGNDGTWADNQTLPPSGGNTNWDSGPSYDHNAELVPGDQFMTIILPSFDTGVQFYASASSDKQKGFAASSVIGFTTSATGGTPPYNYDWDLGNSEGTNVESFSYTYPMNGNFDPQVIVSDSVGNTKTVSIATITMYAATFVDGLNITNDFAGKGTNALQDTISNWGPATLPGNGAQLDHIYAYSQHTYLYVGVCGNLTTGIGERVLGIFIDSDYSVGSNVMPVISAGSPSKLLNLAGMTFDADFTPDKALLLSVYQPDNCWVNVYHINSDSEWYWGTKTESDSIFNPFQRIVNERAGEAGDIVALNDLNTAASPGDANTGLECRLHYATLTEGGLSLGPNVRVQAILYNWQTGNVANQSLPGINGNSSGYGNAPAVDYASVPNLQYIEVGAPIPEPGIVALAGLALLALWRRK